MFRYTEGQRKGLLEMLQGSTHLTSAEQKLLNQLQTKLVWKREKDSCSNTQYRVDVLVGDELIDQHVVYKFGEFYEGYKALYTRTLKEYKERMYNSVIKNDITDEKY